MRETRSTAFLPPAAWYCDSSAISEDEVVASAEYRALEKRIRFSNPQPVRSDRGNSTLAPAGLLDSLILKERYYAELRPLLTAITTNHCESLSTRLP